MSRRAVAVVVGLALALGLSSCGLHPEQQRQVYGCEQAK